MNGPQIACTGCQGKPVKFRPDVGTFLCRDCYAEIMRPAHETIPASAAPSPAGQPTEKDKP